MSFDIVETMKGIVMTVIILGIVGYGAYWYLNNDVEVPSLQESAVNGVNGFGVQRETSIDRYEREQGDFQREDLGVDRR